MTLKQKEARKIGYPNWAAHLTEPRKEMEKYGQSSLPFEALQHQRFFQACVSVAAKQVSQQ